MVLTNNKELEINPKTLKSQLFEKKWYLKKDLIFSILFSILLACVFYSLPGPNQPEHYITTETINESSQKMIANQKLLLENNLENLLMSEGISLNQLRILKQDSPLYSNFYFDEGLKNIQENKLEEAIINFNKSVTMDENLSAGWANMGSCLLSLNGINSSDEALKYYYRAYEIKPNISHYNFNIGYVLLKNSRENPEAIKYLENATRLNPNFSIAWKYLAISSFFAGNHTKSKIAMEKISPIRKNYPDDTLLWSIKLILSQEFDDFDGMLSTYDDAINNCSVCDDFMETIWYNKAIIHAQKNEYDQMIISFDNLLEIVPNKRNEILNIYLKLIGAVDQFATDFDIRSVNEIVVTNYEDDTVAIPSLIYNESIIKGKIISFNIVFFTINESDKYWFYSGSPNAMKPQYRFKENSNTTFLNKPLYLLWYYIDKKIEIED